MASDEQEKRRIMLAKRRATFLANRAARASRRARVALKYGMGPDGGRSDASAIAPLAFRRIRAVATDLT